MLQNTGLYKKNNKSKTKNLVQPKLFVNAPNDVYEQEAETMAERVMRLPSSQNGMNPSGHRIGLAPNCGLVQREKSSSENMGLSVSEFVQSSIESSKGKGIPLDRASKSFMETAFSADFSKIKIHTDRKASDLSNEIHAKAFTVGNDIYFNQGEYNPNSAEGKQLLAHELTHTLQQSKARIQRAPMPAESTVNDLESYTEGTRQNIIYDGGFNFQKDLPAYFKKGAPTDVRDGYNVSYVIKGFDPTESWLEPGLKVLLLFHFHLEKGNTDDAITNITTIQHIDMTALTNPSDTKIVGPDVVVRATSTKFDATGKGKALTQNVQLMVEKLGTFSAVASAEKAADRKKRYETTYQITNAKPISDDPLADNTGAMSDDKFDMVLQALDKVPTGVLSQGTGIPIHRGLSATGPEGEAAEYLQTKANGSDIWERRITVYASFFSMDIDQKAFLMAHEFGHALDFRANEGVKGKGGASLSSASGKGSFAEALKKDGGVIKGVSVYDLTKTKESEYFAEAFTMYINQPKTLKALRPNVYAYFLAKYP